MKTLIGIALAAVLAIPAYAEAKPRHLTCTPGVFGCPAVTPVPGPVVTPTPHSAPAKPVITAATPQGIIGNLITNGLVATVISDLQTLDTAAGVVNPSATLPAPYNTYLPEAHVCIAAAVPFLQNLPSMAAIPSPTGPGGVFTDIGMAEIRLNAVQGFISSLSTTSLEPLKMACAAWAQSIVTAPTTILANVNADTVNFITMFRSL
jgi:hypothetical protein